MKLKKRAGVLRLFVSCNIVAVNRPFVRSVANHFVGVFVFFFFSFLRSQSKLSLINDNMSHFENNKSKQICKYGTYTPIFVYSPFLHSISSLTSMFYEKHCSAGLMQTLMHRAFRLYACELRITGMCECACVLRSENS